MKKSVLEIIYLLEEEEIELFEIIKQYEDDGYRVVLNKPLVECTSDPHTYMIGFSKEEG